MATHYAQLRRPSTRPFGQRLQYLSIGLTTAWSSGYGDLESLSPGLDADYLSLIRRSLNVDV